jgi:hypothetical protein
MSSEKTDRLETKVHQVLAGAIPELPDMDYDSPRAEKVREAIQKAFADRFGDEEAAELSFHMTDWADFDLEFLMALFFAPDKFSIQEVRAGVTQVLIHASNHLAAAAKIAGYPVNSFWGTPDGGHPKG